MFDYRNWSDDELMGALFTSEDRLPREAVDQFLKRGSRLLPRLAAIVSDSFAWNEPLPRWWAVVHAVYILGAIATHETVLPLLKSLRYAEACENDWITEELPSIFGRIGPPAVEGLRRIAADATSGWFARAVACESLAAVTMLHSDGDEDIFRFIRACFVDENEDRRLRQSTGHILLDFLRPDCREVLVAFGNEEKRRHAEDPAYRYAFTGDEVDLEFAGGTKSLDAYTRDWLTFYDPDEIEERRKRWEKEKKQFPGQAGEFCPFAAAGRQKKCCLGRVGAD